MASLTTTAARNGVLSELRLGTIQPFQVEERLLMKGVPSFEIERVKSEIWETYQKEHPGY